MNAQNALTALERGLTNEIHAKGAAAVRGKERQKLAVEYGGVTAAIAALETVG